jgi:hypothetical protein
MQIQKQRNLIEFDEIGTHLIQDGSVKPYTPKEYQLAGVALACAFEFTEQHKGFRDLYVRGRPSRDGDYIEFVTRFKVDPDVGTDQRFMTAVRFDRSIIETDFDRLAFIIRRDMKTFRPENVPVYSKPENVGGS